MVQPLSKRVRAYEPEEAGVTTISAVEQRLVRLLQHGDPMAISWQATTLVQCISVRPWLIYPGGEGGGCHDLTLGKIYEMIGVEGKGSFYRIVDDSGEDYLYPVSHFRAI